MPCNISLLYEVRLRGVDAWFNASGVLSLPVDELLYLFANVGDPCPDLHPYNNPRGLPSDAAMLTRCYYKRRLVPKTSSFSGATFFSIKEYAYLLKYFMSKRSDLLINTYKADLTKEDFSLNSWIKQYHGCFMNNSWLDFVPDDMFEDMRVVLWFVS